MVNYRVQKPDWVEASGTWVGAIASIVAVIIAARVFLSEQFQRERDYRHTLQAQQQQQQAELERAKRQAALIQVSMATSGIQNANLDVVITRMRVTVINGSQQVIGDLGVFYADSPAAPLAEKSVVAPNGNFEVSFVPSREVVLSRREQPIDVLGPRVTLRFKLDGRYRRKMGNADPELLPDPVS